jgi:hypothetical protein
VSTDPQSIPPEDALRIARECHARAAELRAQAAAETERRNVAVQVAVTMARTPRRHVARALGITPTMVRFILQGRNGGGHLRASEVFGTADAPIDLEAWLSRRSS